VREQGEDESAAREVEGQGGETRARGDKAGVVVGCTAIGSMVSGQGSSSADKKNKEPVREPSYLPCPFSLPDWEKPSGLDKIWTRPV
jgi:hypothetical protein